MRQVKYIKLYPCNRDLKGQFSQKLYYLHTLVLLQNLTFFNVLVSINIHFHCMVQDALK